VDLSIDLVCCNGETDMKEALHCMKNDHRARIPDRYNCHIQNKIRHKTCLFAIMRDF
jgi:hypothetical protein